MYPYIIRDNNSLTIVIDGRQSTINRETHPKFDQVIDAIREGDWTAIPDLVDLVSLMGYYASTAAQLTAFDMQLGENQEALLP